MRARQIAPWAAAFLTFGAAACAAVLDSLASVHGEGASTQAAWLAAMLASRGVGVVLATRRGDNVLGWLLLANGPVLAPNGLAATYAQYAVFENPRPPGVEGALTGGNGAFTVFVTVLALIAIPAAIGVAVMRYRLYEIDRLINRTLVYAGLTAGLAATYAAVALLLGVGIGRGSTLPTAVATLAVALVFGPLRARIQVVVDRRFDRARYEGLRVVERYLEA